MPLRQDVPPPGTVGLCVMIVPHNFWEMAYVLDSYEDIAKRAIGTIPGGQRDVEQVLLRAGQIALEAFQKSLLPAIKRLPLEHPDKQDVFRRVRLAVSMFAYLTNRRFFILLLENGVIRFRPIEANTIEEAKEIIMARPDVQEIERRHVDL